FVGRERPLARLEQFLGWALAGQGQVCFVVGEPGSGKTTLVGEFARRVLAQHGELVAALGQADAHTGSGDAYLPFREILAQLTGDVEGKLDQGAISEENAGRLKRLLRFSGQALAEVGPDLIGAFIPFAGLAARAAAFAAERAGWLDRLEKRVGQEAGPGSGIQQEHIFEQYTNVLRALAERQPLLLLLDDLQWADAGSIELLFRLGRRIGDRPILIVGTYRPAEVALGRAGGRHPLAKVLAELKRYQGEIEIDLARAQEAEGRAFVDAVLDSEPNHLDEEFRQALYQHTGGHPLFTVELLRAMQERGVLIQDVQGSWQEGPELDWAALPARVEGVIQKRIGRLEQDLRDMLTIASVEGEDFTAEVIARVQQAQCRDLIRKLSRTLEKQHRLVRAQGIRRLADQRLSQYRFQHSLFRRYLYTELDELERGYLHEDVGLILEELYGEQAGEIAVQLARHFVEAGLDDKARAYLCQAAEQSAVRFANTEAIAHLSRALELTPEAEIVERFKLLLSREKVYGLLGRQDARKQDLDELQILGGSLAEVLSAEEASRLRAEFTLRRGTFAEIVGDYAAAESAAREAIDLARQMGDGYLEARGYRGLGFILLRQGDYAAAQQPLERAIDLARSAGRRQIEAEGLQNLAIVLWRQGKNEPSKSYHQRALAIYRDLGDRYGEAQGLGNLGNVYLGQGDYDAARQCYKESARIDQEIGDRRGEVMSLANLGIIADINGDYARAHARFSQVRDIFAEIGDRASEARALGHLGLVMGNVGNYARARTYCEQGLGIFQEIGNRQAEGWLLNTLGLVLYYLGDDETAQPYIQQGLEIARESGNRSGQAYALTSLGRVQASLGELNAAAASFGQARDIRQELGEPHLVIESTAGLARIFLSQGDLGQAFLYAEEILDYLREGSLEGIENPFEVYLICFRILQAHDDPRSAEILQQAHRLLQERAARIDDAEMRRSFLENVVAHREIGQLWSER
ncbi:MAG: tetratricopeptide repeat protein, partial [Chloroflexia bacterium]|nr:tetratricopeptide repeat protein [Chloroflexia bacterium]